MQVPESPRLSLVHRKVALAALCWISFALVAWAALTGRTANLDTAGLLALRNAKLEPVGPAWVSDIMLLLTQMGGGMVRYTVALAAIGVLIAMRCRLAALWLAATVAIAAAANPALKLLFGRQRPHIVPAMGNWHDASFPSGHAFGSTVLLLAMVLALSPGGLRPSLRRTAICASLSLAALIAFSRVWLGVHWPSDVIAGWLAGIGWVVLASLLLPRAQPHSTVQV